jgi:hypothetical protein
MYKTHRVVSRRFARLHRLVARMKTPRARHLSVKVLRAESDPPEEEEEE